MISLNFFPFTDPDSQFFCHICAKPFENQHDVNRHLWTHDGSEEMSNAVEDDDDDDEEEEETGEAGEDSKAEFQCDKCDKAFKKLDGWMAGWMDGLMNGWRLIG
jgi:hypothetical protein